MAGEVLFDLQPFGNKDFLSFDEFKTQFDQIFGNPTLRDEVHDGKGQEGLVRRAMVCDLRIPVSTLVGPKSPKHLEVFLKHLSERAPQASVCFS